MMKYDVYVSLHNIYLDFLDQQSEKTIPHASFCKTCWSFLWIVIDIVNVFFDVHVTQQNSALLGAFLSLINHFKRDAPRWKKCSSC